MIVMMKMRYSRECFQFFSGFLLSESIFLFLFFSFFFSYIFSVNRTHSVVVADQCFFYIFDFENLTWHPNQTGHPQFHLFRKSLDAIYPLKIYFCQIKFTIIVKGVKIEIFGRQNKISCCRQSIYIENCLSLANFWQRIIRNIRIFEVTYQSFRNFRGDSKIFEEYQKFPKFPGRFILLEISNFRNTRNFSVS